MYHVTNFVKFPFAPAVITVAGPYIGLYRGLKGENTPMAYKNIITGCMEWSDKDKKKDYPACTGLVFALATGTLTSAPFWLAAKTGRWLFYDAHKSLEKGKKMLKEYENA